VLFYAILSVFRKIVTCCKVPRLRKIYIFYRAVNTLPLGYKTSQLLLYREIIAVCSEIRTKHINTVCGQNVELLSVKLAVHIVTTGLCRVNLTVREICTQPYVKILICLQKPAKYICLILWLLGKVTEFYSEKATQVNVYVIFRKSRSNEANKM
jgi:hypothetical protein